jgi:hypothetical protein
MREDGQGGRRLRVLAGVDERVLDQVPSERARYTALGGVVLGTATIAAFSMWAALGQVLGHASAWTLLPVAVWGLFVANLDRWLVSSSTSGAKAWVLPRVLVALVFGVLIAEPLVLRAYASAVEERVAADRQRALVAYESDLRACNPAPGQAVPPGLDCAEKRLTVTAPTADAASRTRAGLAAERDELRAQAERDEGRVAQLNDLARRECNGSRGTGLSGRSGVGPNCERLRAEADRLAAQAGLAATRARLRALDAAIQRLDTEAGRAAGSHEQAVSAAIVAKVAERRATQGSIGLLERFGALDALTAEHRALWWSRWLLTLFFVVVDCLPVIVKLLGARTSYERLVAAKLAGDAEAAEYERGALMAARRHAVDTQLALERARVDAEAAVAAAHTASDLERRLDVELRAGLATVDAPIDLRARANG